MNPFSKKANPKGCPSVLRIVQIKLLVLQEIKQLYNNYYKSNNNNPSPISSITNPSCFNTPRLDFDFD
jgi:hypothetical protein